MRNLKKALSLVLALVFVLGLCTIGAGAAFDDEADIQYKEAITIMNGLGILEGYGDGKFGPLDNVTREQAAKMITYMVLGADSAEKLISKQVFDDVAATRWSAKYIYFCYQKGIINGYGDGNFGPADPVTGIQLAKMLLSAIGYGCMGEYTGEGWDVNVFIDAVSEGVYEDANTASYDMAATREEAALYVFNTLFIENVAYDVDVNVYEGRKFNLAGKVWDLGFTAGDEKAHILTANQGTGADYTVIDGKKYAIETGLDLIGHDVDVYFKNDSKKDAEGTEYFEAYLVEDVSTTVVVGSQTMGELGKELGYPETPLEDVQTWVNYQKDANAFWWYADMNGNGVQDEDETVTGYSLISMFFTMYDDFSKNSIGKANGSLDGANYFMGSGDQLVLDEEGNLISYLTTTYDVAKVSSVEDGVITLSNGWVYYPAAEADKNEYAYAYAYEGIAKKDYVTLQPVGEYLFNIYPTTVATAAIFEKYEMTSPSYVAYFNYYAYMPTSAESSVNVSDAVGTPDQVGIGYTVDFYLDYYGKYFDLDIVSIGEGKGNVLVVGNGYTEDVYAYGESTTYYYAQCIDEEGNETIYLVDPGTSLTTGVYTVYTTTSTYTWDHDSDAATAEVRYYPVDTTVAVFDPLTENVSQGDPYDFEGYGDDNKLPGTNKYFADGMDIIYFQGAKNTLEIELASYFGKEDDATVYCYWDDANIIPVVWVVGDAPAGIADSYIYVDGSSMSGNYLQSYAKTAVNGVDYYYFSPYVDGVSNPFAPISVKEVVDEVPGKLSDGMIYEGFYTYEVDEYGLYKLTPVDPWSSANKEVTGTYTTSITEKDNIYKGKLSIEDMFDDVDISELKIVDLCKAVDSKGYPRNIDSVEKLLDLLADEVSVGISFVAQWSNEYQACVPAGVLYIDSYPAM